MEAGNKENLKNLIEKFLDSHQAEQVADEIQKGQQILCENPAPAPDDKCIISIKAKISKCLAVKKTSGLRRIVCKSAGIAAAAVILTVIGIKLFVQTGYESEVVAKSPMVAKQIWESDDILTDDAELEIIAAEIEQIDAELLNLQFAENGSGDEENISGLEMELIDIDGYFWKG